MLCITCFKNDLIHLPEKLFPFVAFNLTCRINNSSRHHHNRTSIFTKHNYLVYIILLLLLYIMIHILITGNQSRYF